MAQLLRHRRSRAALLDLALDRALDRTGHGSLQRQLYGQVREAVLAGRLAPGARLPSTRTLAGELACSRNTVLGAFEQLMAEGYLECRAGSGTYVSRVLPETLLARPASRTDGEKGEARATLSGEQESLAHAERMPFGAGAGGLRPFAPGVPDLSLFPFDIWGRLLGRIWRHPGLDLLMPAPPAGHRPLREAIAAYLRGLRSVASTPEQVFITAGAQPALDLVARVLLKPGDSVWIEEPGYPGLRGPLRSAGARLVPVPLDEEGLSVTAGRALADDARLAVVAPSHQYPRGTTMSLARRLELLAWARHRGAWLVEDDYDSEYRYAGRPLAALQGLDADRSGSGGGRVFYIGTFSKVLFPAIRLGYLVVPPDLVEDFARARAAIDAYPSAIVQPVLASFMEEGHFAAHVRRMRTVYARRRAALLAAGDRHLAGLLELTPGEGGLHLVGQMTAALAGRLSDREAEARAAAAGLAPRALSRFYLEQPEMSYRASPPARGLLLGFAALADEEIEPAVRTLAKALAG